MQNAECSSLSAMLRGTRELRPSLGPRPGPSSRAWPFWPRAMRACVRCLPCNVQKAAKSADMQRHRGLDSAVEGCLLACSFTSPPVSAAELAERTKAKLCVLFSFFCLPLLAQNLGPTMLLCVIQSLQPVNPAFSSARRGHVRRNARDPSAVRWAGTRQLSGGCRAVSTVPCRVVPCWVLLTCHDHSAQLWVVGGRW